MKKNILTLIACALFTGAFSQGCIPVRNLVGFGQFAKPEYDPVTGETTKWFLNVTQRYYDAHQTYSGKEAINGPAWTNKTTKLYLMNLSVARVLNNGWAVSLDLPVISGSRTSWRPEHFTSDTSMHTTHSFGIGDLRITAYKWLWDISQPRRGNIQMGLGLKLPTGDYRYSDYFYINDNEKVLAPVNSTIQLGDGGTGFTTELNGFYSLSSKFSLYGNIFYLFNPRDVNGVSTMYGQTPTENQKKATADIYSVPDLYTARLGGNMVMNNVTLWAGVRMEGAPVQDLLGSSNGQRRAGKIVSVEPGINYKHKNITFYLFLPFPVFRETKQTVPDKRMSDYTQKEVPSPGGFANYQIFIGVMSKI
jgi:hypothetical protein